MKDFIKFLLQNIVNHPDDLTIKEHKEGSLINIEIIPHPEDMGIIIGKGGKTINSIRNIAKSKAILEKVKVYINVIDPMENA